MEDALVAFVAKGSRRAPKVALSHSVPAGRGLVLTTDVEPGEVILEVPSSVLLHPGALAKQGRLTCAPRKTYSTGKPSKSTLSTHQIVAYALAQWRCTGRPNCPLSPFLYSLPTEFPTAPLTWQVGSNPEEKRLIEALSPTAQLRADKVFKGFERDWNRLIDLETKSPDVLEEIWACMRTSTPRKPLVRADLLWAWLCTNSRCVYMDLHYERHEDNFTLAPLLDMANHTPIPWLECKVRYDARGGLELLAPNHPRPEDAGRAGWRKGDEVCITYGAHANTTLLAEYGFVLPRILHSSNCHWTGNRYCDVLLDAPVGELFGEDENGSWKRELLEKEGYWADYSIHPYPTPAHPSHRLHTALRLLCMSVEQRAKRPRREEADEVPRSRHDAERAWMLATQGTTARISRANEDAVRATMAQLCAAVQKDLERRLQMLDTLRCSDSEQMVRQVLDEERTIAELVRQSAACGDDW